MMDLVQGRMGHLPAKKACYDCPLRKASIPGRLGGYTPQQYVTLLHGPADVACHTGPGFDEGDLSKQRSCTGIAQYRAHQQLEPWGHAYEAMRSVTPDPDTIIEGPVEFLWHHLTTPEKG